MTEPKSFHLSPEIHAYIVEHGTPPDEIQKALIEDTREKTGGRAIMQIAPEQGAFMTQFLQVMGARRAIEIGTFTGYSALCIARGLPEEGELICCDVSHEWAEVGKPYWHKAGVAHKIDLRIAPALETLRSLPREPGFDFAFIDADKTGYADYLEELVPRVRRNGVIAVDNVLWMGQVVNEQADDESTVALRAFNRKAAEDDRLDTVMLPISDGLSLLRVR